MTHPGVAELQSGSRSCRGSLPIPPESPRGEAGQVLHLGASLHVTVGDIKQKNTMDLRRLLLFFKFILAACYLFIPSHKVYAYSLATINQHNVHWSKVVSTTVFKFNCRPPLLSFLLLGFYVHGIGGTPFRCKDDSYQLLFFISPFLTPRPAGSPFHTSTADWAGSSCGAEMG